MTSVSLVVGIVSFMTSVVLVWHHCFCDLCFSRHWHCCSLRRCCSCHWWRFLHLLCSPGHWRRWLHRHCCLCCSCHTLSQQGPSQTFCRLFKLALLTAIRPRTGTRTAKNMRTPICQHSLVATGSTSFHSQHSSAFAKAATGLFFKCSSHKPRRVRVRVLS